MAEYQAILVLINPGFSDVAMDAAREEGAHGGTIIHARGTGNKEIEQKFGVIITPEKELLIIVVKKDISDKVMGAVNKACGLQSKGHGIIFSLPIDNVSGLKYE